MKIFIVIIRVVYNLFLSKLQNTLLENVSFYKI